MTSDQFAKNTSYYYSNYFAWLSISNEAPHYSSKKYRNSTTTAENSNSFDWIAVIVAVSASTIVTRLFGCCLYPKLQSTYYSTAMTESKKSSKSHQLFLVRVAASEHVLSTRTDYLDLFQLADSILSSHSTTLLLKFISHTTHLASPSPISNKPNK